MNVASLELCKELYELSWWDDTDKWLHLKGNGDTMLFDPIEGQLMDCDAPAYDLSYLLRKLPDRHAWLRYDEDTEQWFMSNKLHQEEVSDDTPENAAAKLAIELFKQGILTKEVV